MAECLLAYHCPAEWFCLHQQRLGHGGYQNKWEEYFLMTVMGTAQGHDTRPYKGLAKGWLVIKGTIYRS